MSAEAIRPGTVPELELAPAAERAVLRSYPLAIKVLHWLTALLVAIQIASGIVMMHLGGGPSADLLFTLHKTNGAAILLLVALRLGLRLALKATGRWRRHATLLPIHAALYGALILIPVLGWAGISDFGARTIVFGWSLPPIWPEGAGYDGILFTLHAYLAFALLALVAAHIGVALGLHLKRGVAGADPAAADPAVG